MTLQERQKIGHKLKKMFGTKVFSILMDHKNGKQSPLNKLEEFSNLMKLYQKIDKGFVDFVIKKNETKVGVFLHDALRGE